MSHGVRKLSLHGSVLSLSTSNTLPEVGYISAGVRLHVPTFLFDFCLICSRARIPSSCFMLSIYIYRFEFPHQLALFCFISSYSFSVFSTGSRSSRVSSLQLYGSPDARMSEVISHSVSGGSQTFAPWFCFDSVYLVLGRGVTAGVATARVPTHGLSGLQRSSTVHGSALHQSTLSTMSEVVSVESLPCSYSWACVAQQTYRFQGSLPPLPRCFILPKHHASRDRN